MRGVELHAVRFHTGGADPPIAVVQRRIGHKGFNYKSRTRFQVDKNVAKTAQLVLLTEQREERIEHDVDQAIRALDRDVRKIARRHRNLCPTWFGAHLGDHRFGGIDTVYAHTVCGEWERHPSGADAQLERRAVARQLSQKCCRWLGRVVYRAATHAS